MMLRNNHRNIFLRGIKFFSGAISVILGLGIMAVYAQNCTLLPTRAPLTTLSDGQSLTGYISPDATYTQDCTGLQGVITCVNGIVQNGNTYKYPSCTPHTWANCTTPVAANHLEYKPLYKLSASTLTQTCQQLSQQFQCINQFFTGTNVGLYPFGSCTNQIRSPCINTWNNSYVNHLGNIIGYTNNAPINQSCSSVQVTLSCSNGFWSPTQAGKRPTCSATYNGDCVLSGGAILASGASTTMYSTLLWSVTGQNYTNGCAPFSGHLTCVNGNIQGGSSNFFQYSLAQCQNTLSPQDCTQRSGGIIYHGTTKTGYSATGISYPQNCNNVSAPLTCINGAIQGNYQYYQYTLSQCTAGLPQGCTLPRGAPLAHNTTGYGYSTVLRSITGQNYLPNSCNLFSGALFCNNGVLQGNPGFYHYSIYECSIGSPKSCYWTGDGMAQTAIHGYIGTRYSATGASYPQNCSNVSTTLSCVNGLLNGNRQAYQYSTCTPLNPLISGIDLALNNSIGLPGGGTGIAQGTSPILSLNIKNNGDTIFSSPEPAGFIICKWLAPQTGIILYTSPAIAGLVINPGTQIGLTIQLSSIFTQSLGNKVINCILNYNDSPYLANNTRSTTFGVIKSSRFDIAMSRSIESIQTTLEPAGAGEGTTAIQNFVFDRIMSILVPLVVVIGILLSLLGFYKLMFSTEDKAIEEGTNYVIYGLVGIIIMVSAKFIGTSILNILSVPDIKGYAIAQSLYDKIFFPFIKIAIYVVLGAMFVILITRVISFLFGTDADAKKKAGLIIGWNVVGMLIIIGAKQIVEAVYGKYTAVVHDISNLGEIGSGILADKNIPLIYQIVNWALGLIALVILIMIIVQAIQLLMKPDDEKQMTNIKNTLMYVFIGLFVIGAGYLIVNFLIVQ